MELKTSKKLLTAIPLVLGLAMMGPQMALADDDKDGKDNDREFTVCKKFVFFDKIIFEFKHELFDIKVPDKLSELADLKGKVQWWFKRYKNEDIHKEDIEIKDVDFAAVCAVTQEVKERPKNKDVVCTLEAKLCPDGSSVGRVPPSCEFAPCPGE